MPLEIDKPDTGSAASGLTRRHFLGALASVATVSALPSRSHAKLTTLPTPLPVSMGMRAGDFRKAPKAWISLIKRHPKLDPAGHKLAPITLSAEQEAQLVEVQDRVNRLIYFRPESKDVWQLGVLAGDCEDFAISKLDILCGEYGWPRSALTLAACYTERGQGHAVLLAHTHKGVYVLDNRRAEVKPWHRLPYRWIAREEPGAPFGLWRKLKA